MKIQHFKLCIWALQWVNFFQCTFYNADANLELSNPLPRLGPGKRGSKRLVAVFMLEHPPFGWLTLAYSFRSQYKHSFCGKSS